MHGDDAIDGAMHHDRSIHIASHTYWTGVPMHVSCHYLWRYTYITAAVALFLLINLYIIRLIIQQSDCDYVSFLLVR
jgi:hypothetical protein